MKISIKNIQGKDAGELEVKFPMVEGGKGTQAVHDTVVAFQAAQRSGTACTKTAGEVAGTNKKPWRQKGTGRARAGSFQSPIFVGGGVVFGPKPRDFSKKISKNTKQLAMRKALTERLKAGDVIIVEDLKLGAAKTKEFVGVLDALDIQRTALFVVDGSDKNFQLASRNVPNMEVATTATVNTYQLLRSDKLVFTRGAFQKLEERLQK